MTLRTIRVLSFAAALIGASIAVSAPPSDLADLPGLPGGDLTSLHVHPSSVEIRGSDRRARLVISGVFANGGARDLTREAAVTASDVAIARVDEDLHVLPVSDGKTSLRVEFSGQSVDVPVVIVGAEVDRPIHFANDIVPVFSKFGCNGGGCHGKSGGQNGFQLSLFGFTPPIDYKSLVRESRGRRVFPAQPERSLLLLKATGTLPHGGGALLDQDSAEYELLSRWIGSGLPYGSSSAPFVESVEVFPRHRAIPRGGSQQLAVTALYSDGRREDVTHVAEFSVNEKEFLDVDKAGLVRANDLVGSGAVLVRYKGHVDAFRATIPSELDVSRFEKPAPVNFIDEHVFRRLDEIGIPPSKLSADAVFVRRAFLTICGSLPTTDEVSRFLADERDTKQKRAELIDVLLGRREHASYFALLWADVLRNRRGNDNAAPLTIRFRNWIEAQLLAGTSYDEFVRQVVCAEGEITDNPTVGWYRDLANAKALVDDTAQVFLGTRIQCARCHHHPHEKWSQDDYWHFANFFSRVKTKNRNDSRDFTVTVERRASRLTDDEETSATYRKTYSKLAPLGAGDIEAHLDEDPRERLVDWMVSSDDKLLAKALVNRYWKHFFGRGIVEPEDDFRATNPASNPALLDALANDFVASGYDLRHLVRTICNSTTFQLSAVPNEHNVRDVQNFSRFQPRRMPAEVCLDAVDKALGTSTTFEGLRRGARAIDLPDEGSRNYFLDVFGKPARTTACACERSGEVTLSQILEFLNSRHIAEKIAATGAPPAVFAASDGDDREKARQLFLRVFGRPAREEEIARAVSYVAERAGEKRARQAVQRAWEDVVWALLNSKEFVFIR